MTTALAIYAAAAATLGIGWQVYTWRHDRKPHVEVNVELVYPMTGNQPVQPLMVVTAVSRSSHPVRALNAGLRVEGEPGKIGWGMKPHPLSTIPGVIQPHDSATAFFDPGLLALQGVDLEQELRGGVALSTGDQFWSEPAALTK